MDLWRLWTHGFRFFRTYLESRIIEHYGTCIARHIICRKILSFSRLDRLASCVNNMYLLGFRSSIPSHTPLENWVVPMNRTTPKSAPVTKTLIPVIWIFEFDLCTEYRIWFLYRIQSFLIFVFLNVKTSGSTPLGTYQYQYQYQQYPFQCFLLFAMTAEADIHSW